MKKLLRWLFPVLGDMKDTMAGPVAPSLRPSVAPVQTKGGYRHVATVPATAEYIDLITGIVPFETPYVTGDVEDRR